MKYSLLSLVCLAFLAAVASGCGPRPAEAPAGAPPPAGAGTGSPAPPPVPGRTASNTLFDVLVPEGWECKDETVGYPDAKPYAMFNMGKKGREMYVMFTVQRNTEETPEAHVAKYLRDNPNLKATPPEKASFAGTEWVKTTYTYGTFQVMYVARFANLHQVKILCQGAGVGEDAGARAILDSLKFRLDSLPAR